MKRWISIFIVICCSFVAFSQEYNSLTSVDNKQERTLVHASTIFSADSYSNKFFINSFGVDYFRKIDNKTSFYVGANLFNINMNTKDLIDRSPRRKNTASFCMGMSYKANDNLILSGDIFYNGIYNIVGADLNLKFLLSEDSFFEFSASFSRQLPTAGYHQPISYGYNDVFHPFIFGY